MNRRKKTVIVLGVFMLICTISYYALLPFDYKVRFKTQNAPWLVYHLIEINHVDTQISNYEENYLSFSSRPKKEGVGYRYNWRLIKESNNITRVEVNALFTVNRFLEKTALLFGKSNKVKSIIEELNSFKVELTKTFNDYQWEQPILDKLPAQTCLCTSISSRIEDKANEMNKTISLLSNYLPKGKKSPPRLYINQLDLINQTISFDFCFPIETDMVIDIKESGIFITLKPEIRGEAITFYGNYSQSHRGWYSYMANHIGNKSPKLPFVEVFYDSPFGGIEQAKWKSKAYFSENKRN